MASNVPMIVITTSSSISVKPPVRRRCAPRSGWRLRMGSPVMIGHSIQALGVREGVDVVDVIARLRIGGRTLVTAQTPGVLAGRRGVREERIAGNASQEIHVRMVGVQRVLDSRVQGLEIRRIAARSELE